jgi:hypothetical protein
VVLSELVRCIGGEKAEAVAFGCGEQGGVVSWWWLAAANNLRQLAWGLEDENLDLIWEI